MFFQPICFAHKTYLSPTFGRKMQPGEFTILFNGLIIMNIENPVKKNRRCQLPLHPLNNIYEPPKRIDIQSLAADQGLFRMSYGFDLSPLVESIKEAGLLNPPLVYSDENGKMDVVSGYRRILALKEIGCTAVPCVVLPSTMPGNKCMLLNFYDNIATRTLNPVEKAMACRRLSSLFPRPEVLTRFMPALGLPSHESTLGLYNAIDTEFDDEMKHALASGRMPVKAAGELLKFPEADRQAFRNLFLLIKFNSNQQLQIFDLISDISVRDGKPVSTLLDEEPFRTVIEDKAMNTPQKARAFLDRCRRIRHPLM
ncbi:MAG TPA: ParB/RepB/Spo0J family partition protein, partial [Desulfobacteraceae bacterium]|nr:ParB/RepB/Spo0J family partition protein [Desulfobacteraceae bacterium]